MYDSGLDFVDIFKKWQGGNKKLEQSYITEIRSKTSKKDPLQRQEWPNSYTFTKNMAENVVKHYCSSSQFNITASIIRLGIVSPIHRGKHLGWFMGNGGFVF
eukprot:TRINITY_DN19763_c0_g1_i1.p1 TRINITY_DN19763_c0_g1~~TRINITY_DN19763_c0_g1_i1.p1  ORF type:complete len:102 (-),score=2.25 TRINITY_DN19763_c0_g1_i1:10-315(-)